MTVMCMYHFTTINNQPNITYLHITSLVEQHRAINRPVDIALQLVQTPLDSKSKAIILLSSKMAARNGSLQRLATERTELPEIVSGRRRIDTESTPKLTTYDQGNPEGSLMSLSQRNSTDFQLHQSLLKHGKSTLMKNILKDSYSQQIRSQQYKRTQQRKLTIMQERDLLSQFETQKTHESQQKLKEKQKYRRQLLEGILQKKVSISQARTEETSLEKMYQQPRQHHLVHKEQSFRKFYDDVQQVQKRVDSQYKGYMEEEEKYKKSRHKDRIIYYKQNMELMERQSRETSILQKEKQMDLRRILDDQVEKKQQEKQKQKLRELSRRKKRTTQLRDSIYNPIDFKMDINNKYILGEILKANRGKSIKIT